MPRPLPDWLPDEEASAKEAELRAILKELMREQSVTISALTHQVDIKESRLRSILYAGSRMQLVELICIASVLGYDLDLVLNRNAFDPSD